MFTLLTRRAFAIVLLALAGLVALHGGPGAAAGHGETHGLDERFRIYFHEKTAEPFTQGPLGKRNRLAIERISRVLGKWATQLSLRFIFVAPRPSDCDAVSECTPQHLMWQRVNAATARIKDASAGHAQGLPYHLMGFAFLNEFSKPPELPPATAGAAAIYLRAYVDGGKDQGQCPWRAMIFDPELPPVIGSEQGRPSVPVPPGSSVMVHPGLRLWLRPGSSLKPGWRSHAVWENERKEFRRASSKILSGAVVSVLRQRQTLHIIAATSSNRDLEQFISALSIDFKRLGRIPPFLDAKKERKETSKGIGDHVHRFEPGRLSRLSRTDQAMLHCRFTFLPAPNLPGVSSR